MALDTGSTGQSDYDAKCVHDTLRKFGQMSTKRSAFAAHWEEIAELIDPNSRNTFMFGNSETAGTKRTQQQVDATGMMALGRFAAICDSLLTPRNSMWHMLEADNAYVMKDRATRLWFEDVTNILFKNRYAPHANFTSQNAGVFRNLGAYGTGGIFMDKFDSPTRPQKGIRYRSCPVGELFIEENHQGLVTGCIRWFQLTAAQIYDKWGPEKFPETMRTPLENNSQMRYDILHHVCERKDYEADRLDMKGKYYASYYVIMQSKTLMQEGGYNTFPYSISRYEQTPNEVYGRSPAMSVLPALKTLNAQKRTFLKQAHRAADPVLLVADDGIMDFSLRPGAINKGGVSSDGKRLVQALETGNIQLAKEAMQEEAKLINDAFLVTLFQILTETPQMTATEVVERTNEKGILLAPTMGRQQSEYLGPLIDRELDLMSEQSLLPPMPPRLKEAGGEYSVVYTSPLSRAMKAQGAAGFMRTVENVKELVNITQDPSLLDPFDFDVAIPAIADIQAVPASWMASPDKVKQKRDARAKQQQIQQQIQAAPAQAAMMKAQAVQAKAGIPQQGQPQGQPQQGQPPQQ